MPGSDYDPEIVNQLRKTLWSAAFGFARENRITVSGLELLTALHLVEEEARHHWIEDHKKWNDILRSRY
jgi:hypothetical protein